MAEYDEKIDKTSSGSDDMNAHGVQGSATKPQARKLYDPDISFEEYHFWALKTREAERDVPPPKTPWLSLLTRKKTHDVADEKNGQQVNLNLAKEENRMLISDEEWVMASRAYRQAGWGACFYLITTDILGPFATPYAIGSLGYGPGVGLFTLFGVTAGYSGYLLWHVYMGVDSDQFPARNYGDLAFRTWGTIARHFVNFLQALALLLLLGQVTILFGNNIYELSNSSLCYIVCPLIFILAGFFMTQVRTLRNFGIFATLSIWLNLLVIFITMGIIAHSPPDYKVVAGASVGEGIDPASVTPVNGKYPAIIHAAGFPTNKLYGEINGLLSGVLAYAGAQLFIEFMAEMKRPRDFLKAMWGAQFFIYTVYVVYGCYVYYFQGQYVYNPTYQGVSSRAWSIVGNVLTLVAGLIASALYGNIGIKVFYNNICCDLLNAPLITSRPGKIAYAAIVPFWWSLAFLIAAAIPAYAAFVGIISASCLLNLTYTIPPWLALGYDIKRNAMRPQEGDGYDPVTGQVIRRGTVMQRWMRGFTSGGTIQVLQNVWHVLYFLCSFGMCGLGMWASIEAMIFAFDEPQLTSFSCTAPT